MSRPRSIGAYPAWLVSLLTDFEGDRRPRTLRFNTRREVRAFQLDLSGFKGAVRAEGAEDLWPNTLAARTRTAQEADYFAVQLYHADDTPAPKVSL